MGWRWAIAAMGVGVAAAMAQPERRGRPAGPRDDGSRGHQIHLVASTDGLSFEETAAPIMTQAGAADVIQLERDLARGFGPGASKGDLCIYAVDASRTGRSGVMSRLVSKDDGKTWTGGEAIRLIGPREQDWSGIAVDPSVVQLADGRLRLYFLITDGAGPEPDREEPAVPSPGPEKVEPFGLKPLENPNAPVRGRGRGSGDPSKRQVYSAISADGAKFTVEDEFRFEEAGIGAPEVVKAGAEWLMFLSRGDEVVLARSGDGVEFKKDRGFILRGGGAPGAAVMGDGRVRVYQSGRDGITSVVYDPGNGAFRPDEGVRVAGRCADPAVWARAGGGYLGLVKRWMAAGK